MQKYSLVERYEYHKKRRDESLYSKAFCNEIDKQVLSDSRGSDEVSLETWRNRAYQAGEAAASAAILHLMEHKW